MLNYIWGGMLLIGIAFAAGTGSLGGVTALAVDSSKNAVTLAITMAGVVGMWSGIMNVAEKAGLIALLSEKMRGPLRFLFPNIPKNHPANKYIATNFIANIFGLGWAATPAGLKAMEELQRLSRDKRTASNEMCLFMVINMSSLQLVSVNLIAYRQAAGSVNPAEIIGPGILVTALNTVIAILLCKVCEKVKW